jgi:hypothetical protein
MPLFSKIHAFPMISFQSDSNGITREIYTWTLDSALTIENMRIESWTMGFKPDPWVTNNLYVTKILRARTRRSA